MRFFESEGKKTGTEIIFFQKIKEIYKVNFMGRNIEKLKSGRKIEVEVRPWEIITLKMRV